MIPVVAVTSGRRPLEKFLTSYVLEEGIEESYVARLEPAGKEFGIAQIKELIKEVSFSSPQRKLYVLHDFHTASLEAQNAFLKTLEEHQENIGFVMVVETKYILLPTILSRSRVISLPGSRRSEPDGRLDAHLAGFVADPQIRALGSELLEVSSQASQKRVFASILNFFRGRLLDDSKAPLVLSEALSTFAAVTGNNMNAQNALDHLLLFVRKTYTPTKT